MQLVRKMSNYTCVFCLAEIEPLKDNLAKRILLMTQIFLTGNKEALRTSKKVRAKQLVKSKLRGVTVIHHKDCSYKLNKPFAVDDAIKVQEALNNR